MASWWGEKTTTVTVVSESVQEETTKTVYHERERPYTLRSEMTLYSTSTLSLTSYFTKTYTTYTYIPVVRPWMM